MGCDIHVRTERKEKGQWVPVEDKVKNPYYDPSEEDNEWESEYHPDYWYRGRNYTLFAALADVRSYGDAVPICQPKGFPKDASEDVRKEYERWDCDAHSASYLTLQELNKYHREHDFNEISTEFYAMMKKMQALAKGSAVPVRPVKRKKVVSNPLTAQGERTALLTEIAIPERETTERDIRIVFWFDN